MNDDRMEENKKDTHLFTRRNFFSLIGVASLATGGFFTYSYFQAEDDMADAPKDMAGNSVSLDIPLTNDEIEKMNIEPLHQVMIDIEDLDLHSAVSSMNSVEGVINPPDAKQTFLLKDYGTTLDKPAEGTLYVVAHSLKSGEAPGNYLFDWQNDKILVEEGQLINIAELTYKVSMVDLSQKTNIGDHETIWNNEPNTLVFITCLQQREGRSVENLIVIADLVEDK